MTGRHRLYGLGLGPGDPELVTLKALRLLRAVPVVAYSGARSRRQFRPPHRRRMARPVAARNRDPLSDAPGTAAGRIYRAAAAQIAAVLDGGDDVAYLCQGDPAVLRQLRRPVSRHLAGRTR